MKKKIYQDNKINMDDYEGIQYPDLDIKRAVIDKMLADKLNEVFRILAVLQEQIDNLISEPLCWRTDCNITETTVAPHIHTEQDQEKLEDREYEHPERQNGYKCGLCRQYLCTHQEMLETHIMEKHCKHIETEV